MIHPETKKTTIIAILGTALLIAAVFFVMWLLVGCSQKNVPHRSVDDPKRGYRNEFAPVKQFKPSIRQ